MDLDNKYRPVTLAALALLALGIVSWLVSLVTSPKWGIMIVNFIYFVGISEAAIFIVVMLRTANVKWAKPLYRIGGLVTMSFLPMAIALFVVVLLGQGAFFYWIGGEGHGPANPWLNPFFFTIRQLLLFALFYYFAWQLFNISMTAEDLESAGTNRALLLRGVPLMIIFVVHQSVIGWDMAMTLFPHFLSTVFTIKFWVTNVYGGFSASILILVVLNRYFGINITKEQFFHFGNLMLAFSIFWIYFTWADFFPFWYANLPEETPVIYASVFSKEFGSMYVLRLALGAIPFVILTFSKVRRNIKVLQPLAVAILIGVWLERYLMVIPPLVREEQIAYTPLFGLTNILLSVGILGGFIASLIIAVSKYADILTKEPAPETDHH